MKKLLMAALIGALFGGGLTEAFHRMTDSKNRERFERNVRCKRIADEFVSKNSSEYRDVMLNEVRFSAARNECVASVDEVSRSSPSDLWRYTVVEVVSGGLLFSDMCDEDKNSSLYCGDGRNMEIRRKRDKAFKDAVN